MYLLKKQNDRTYAVLLCEKIYQNNNSESSIEYFLALNKNKISASGGQKNNRM